MQITPQHNFASDNASGVHPLVMAKMAEVNHGHVVGYGNDPYTHAALERFKETFGAQSESYMFLNGTGTNVLALKGLAQSYETVYCSDEAHLLVDECGAPEAFVGCKLVTLPSANGKIDVTTLEAQVTLNTGFVHRSQPRVITLTQATERGTVYSLEELKAAISFARRHDLYVHIDGARIHNAAAALGVSFKEMTTDLGVDVVSFGGTKNGLMMAEAIVVLNPDLHAAFPYIRKQGMQLVSKHHFLAAQYLAYFEDDLWLKNATHANEIAAYFTSQLATFSGVEITSPVDINVIFARLPADWIKPLQSYCYFNIWDAAKSEVRFITSFDTTKEDIDGFIAEMKKLPN